MPLPEPIYISYDPGFNPASAAAILPVSQPVFSSPFTGVNIDYELTQKFQCRISAFKSLPVNSKWGTWQGAPNLYQDFLLCAESPRECIGGDVVQWTRTYAKIPASYSLASSYVYTFPAFQSVTGVNTTAQSGRDQLSEKSAARVQYDYFLIDPTNGTPTGPIYNKATSIPIIDQQRYYLNKDVIDLRLFATSLTSANFDSNPTVPKVEDYLAWIAAKLEIVAEASTLRPWLGNIVERQTVYILPQ
jgi:hypothetical protein